jgi:hypothetical protein
MKTQTQANQTARCLTQGTFALAALLLGACSATTQTKHTAMTERHGQVKFSSKTDKIVGEIAIQHDEKNFRAEITKGLGVPLLSISAKFGTPPKVSDKTMMQMTVVRVSGPLAHGGWSWRPTDLLNKKVDESSLDDPSRAWAALPEVFMWGEAQAKGSEGYRVTLPNVVMHSRGGNGQVRRFDYTRHKNPSGVEQPINILRRQPKLETVICHLD